MSSAIAASSAFESAAASATKTIDASIRIHVPFGLARLVTIGGSGFRLAAAEYFASSGTAGATASGRLPAWSPTLSTCMPKRPPAPIAKHVRMATSATVASMDDFFGGAGRRVRPPSRRPAAVVFVCHGQNGASMSTICWPQPGCWTSVMRPRPP